MLSELFAAHLNLCLMINETHSNNTKLGTTLSDYVFMETLELTLVIKLKNADAGWIEEAIRQGLEDGEEIVDFYHSNNLPNQ